MQALTQIGFTEKDFELASKIIEFAIKSNKLMSGETSLAEEFGLNHPLAKMMADRMQDKMKIRRKEAIEESEELVGLQYKMIRLKRLIAQDGANGQTMG